jgi:DNA-binding NarL/FixJ family response regulator
MQTHSCGPAYRIAIADDHTIDRVGIRAILQNQPGFEICAEAANGIEAIECVKRESPDLLVLDLALPKTNSFEIARVVRDEIPSTAILILSVHLSTGVARELFRQGIRGYVQKTETKTELVEAIRCIKQGNLFFSRELAKAIVNSFAHPAAPIEKRSVPAKSVDRLTPRELVVIELLANGFRNKEVAKALDVSIRTAESHRSHIMRKMKFANFSEMVRYAIQAGIIES